MINLSIILFCFFLFLFFLYYLARDDFVIVRKGLNLEKVFNIAILTAIATLILARLSFAFFVNPKFFNPLVFLAIPYYWGLSLIGGVVGGSLFLYFYALLKKVPVGRLFDLFTMSFIGVFPIGMLFYAFSKLGKESVMENVVFVSSILILFVFTKLIFPFSSRGEIKDGSLGLIFILILSFIYFTGNLFLDIKNFSFLASQNIFVLITFFGTVVLIINQEIMNKYLTKR